MAVLNGYIPQLYRRRVRFIEKYIMEALEIEALKTDPNAAKDVNRGNSVELLSGGSPKGYNFRFPFQFFENFNIDMIEGWDLRRNGNL